MLSMKSLLSKIVNYLNDVTTETFSWSSTTDGGGIDAAKWGKVVTLTVKNPTKLAEGNNIIFTLPLGWRPAIGCLMVWTRPAKSTASTTNTDSLRLEIRTTGEVMIYNYRGEAISSNTNATNTITYVVGG